MGNAGAWRQNAQGCWLYPCHACRSVAPINSFGPPGTISRDAGDHAFIHEIDTLLSRCQPFCKICEVRAITLSGASAFVMLDSDGWPVLSAYLKRAVSMDGITVAGPGHIFPLWETTRFSKYRAKAMNVVRAYRRVLGPQPSQGAREP